MSKPSWVRSWFASCGLLTAVAASGCASDVKADAPVSGSGWGLTAHEVPGFELVMQIVATCANPERPGPASESKDGIRGEIWPIVGGRFEGLGIRGSVVPGGGDFPVTRPDGVEVVDALYRLKTDDGTTIIIHNKGISYGDSPDDVRYRLNPEFTAPKGKYDWLNKSMFVATLVWPVPADMAVAKGPDENDRLIEVYRVK